MNENSNQPQTVSPPPIPNRQMPQRSMNYPKAGLLSTNTAGIIAFLGILVFFIGILLLQSTGFLEIKSMDDYDLYKNLTNFGRILTWLGILFLTTPLYLIGITNSNLDWKVRATMISSATAIVIASMVIVMFSNLSSLSMMSYYSLASMMG